MSPSSELRPTRSSRGWLRFLDFRWRSVHEFRSAGLVVDRVDSTPRGILVATTDQGGQLLWTLPSRQSWQGETPEQTAVRAVREETGIDGEILAELGVVDLVFPRRRPRVHKNVRYYLLRRVQGQLTPDDTTAQVAWLLVPEISSRLELYAERRLVEVADRLLTRLGSG